MHTVQIVLTLLFLLAITSEAVVITSATAGSYSWTAPTGISSVTIECWGAGGGGANRTSSNAGGGGGGGGAYAMRQYYPITSGNAYSLRVASANAQNVSGGASLFQASACYANGGKGTTANSATGGTGGDNVTSTGTFKFKGGNGGTWASGTNGMGGGSSGGPTLPGNTPTNATAGVAVLYGGPGGAGAPGTATGNGSAPASGPGGGGGGAYHKTTGTGSGGSSFAGRLRLSYTDSGSSYAIIQSTNISNGFALTSSQDLTLDSSQTGGNFNIISFSYCIDGNCLSDPTQTVTSVADSQGNIWTKAIGPFGHSAMQIWYSSATTGSNTVTVTLSAGVSYLTLFVGEWSGIDLTSPLDTTGISSGTLTDAAVTPTAATSNADELEYSVISSGAVPTNNSGLWLQTNGGNSSQWENCHSVGTKRTQDWLQASAGFVAAVATFNPQTSAPAGRRRIMVVE